jgi:excisionase family DNA binding protein
MNGESVWLTAKEAAQYLKVETRTLLLWARQGKLKAYALSGTARHVWRFRVEDLDAALMASPVLLSSPSSAVPAEKEAAC